MGKLSADDLNYFKDEQSRNYLLKKEQELGIKEGISPTQLWSQRFPNASPLAIDLLSKLITFNPTKRLTIYEAIQHDYFAQIIALETPPKSQVKFNWEWEYNHTKLLSSIPLVKKLIYMESLFFHPEEQQVQQQRSA